MIKIIIFVLFMGALVFGKLNCHKHSTYCEMMNSFEEAIRIQEKFNGMANVNQIAITLFIQRTKGGGHGQ